MTAVLAAIWVRKAKGWILHNGYFLTAIAVLLLYLFLFAWWPFGSLLLQGVEGLDWAFIRDEALQWRLIWSLTQALLTVFLTLCLSLPIGWMLARFDFSARFWLIRCLTLPFVMPSLVAGIGVLALFGPNGLFKCDLQDSAILLLYGNLFFNLPLVSRAALDGFARIPATHLAAARTLGASAWRAFWRVEWPAVLPWVSPALCLVFLYCFGGFGLALLLGGQRYATVEVEIYILVAYELKLSVAMALALVFLGINSVCVLFYMCLERRLKQQAPYFPIARRPISGLWPTSALCVVLAILAFFSAAPLLALLGRAFAVPLATWLEVLMSPDSQLALFNTLRFAVITVVLATVLGLIPVRALSFVPYMLSPICIAFGLLLCYPELAASLSILIGAYVLMAFPLVNRSVMSALDSLPRSLPAVAYTLGATKAQTFWRVILPLTKGALCRGMAFAAATAIGEFAVSLFLLRPEWLTLSTLIYQMLSRPGSQQLDMAMILSAVLMLFTLFVFSVIEWPAYKKEKSVRTESAHEAFWPSSGR